MDTSDRIKRRRSVFPLLTLLILFFVPSLSRAEKRRGPIVLGVGVGYSFFLDSGLSSYEVYHTRLIYFSEQLSLKNNINLYAQYFPWRGFGFQLEFDHQIGGYHSDLDWYGHLASDGRIIEIGHIEEPYKERWTISSITASILYALILNQNGGIRPYISAGAGLYFSHGDDERFYQRTRLGPKKSGSQVKLGLGVKYRITSTVGINLKGVAGTVWRRGSGWGNTVYFGPEQFDYDLYAKTGKIVRRDILIARTYSYLGIMMGLEFTL